MAGSTITKSVDRISDLVEPRRRSSRRRRRATAPISIAPSAAATASAEREAGAERQPREDIAAVAVGAEQQQRRGRLVRGSHQTAAGQPRPAARAADRSSS